jgi:hypothetical protein
MTIEIRSDRSVLGTLIMGRGSVQWWPSGNLVNAARKTWRQFAVYAEQGDVKLGQYGQPGPRTRLLHLPSKFEGAGGTLRRRGGLQGIPGSARSILFLAVQLEILYPGARRTREELKTDVAARRCRLKVRIGVRHLCCGGPALGTALGPRPLRSAASVRLQLSFRACLWGYSCIACNTIQDRQCSLSRILGW